MTYQPRKDLTGERFGRLTATRRLGQNRHQQALWECVCDCGKVIERSVTRLMEGRRKGHLASCGCHVHTGPIKRAVLLEGELRTAREISQASGLTMSGVYHRMKRGVMRGEVMLRPSRKGKRVA